MARTEQAPNPQRAPQRRAGRRADGAAAPTGATSRPRPGASGAVDVHGLSAEIIALSSRLAVGTCDLLRLIGEFDAAGAYAVFGALSCAVWLADTCDIELVTAHNQVRVARSMRAWPLLDAAMADGDISYGKARIMAAHLNDDNVAELVRIATITPVGRLGVAIASWLHRNEEADVIERRQHAQRFVSIRTEPDGMVTITARLEPMVAGAICAVIDRAVTVDHSQPETPTGADDVTERPSLGQQRADALERIIVGAAEGGTAKPSVTAEVVVHVRDDGNTLADGTPLSDNAVTAMLPESFVSLLIHDNERQPIDASPRRQFPTRRQRRVVDERYVECAHPGCHARALLQYDHIDPRRFDGPTVVDNLQRLCGPHNRAKGARRPSVPPDELDGAA
ncbi:MAG: DUF222 domain-containing protein [Actinobacteria bacterium]|nr:DUF222 domain-containing protein [Actinomycetota bacterium]